MSVESALFEVAIVARHDSHNNFFLKKTKSSRPSFKVVDLCSNSEPDLTCFTFSRKAKNFEYS